MPRKPWASKGASVHWRKTEQAKNPALAKERQRRAQKRKRYEQSLNGPVTSRKATPEEIARW